MPFVLKDGNQEAAYIIGIAKHHLEKLANKKERSVPIEKVKKLIEDDDGKIVNYVKRKNVYSLARFVRKKDEQMEVRNARTLSELKVIEQKRGYKTGWAYAKFMSRKKGRRFTSRPLNSDNNKNNSGDPWNW